MNVTMKQLYGFEVDYIGYKISDWNGSDFIECGDNDGCGYIVDNDGVIVAYGY